MLNLNKQKKKQDDVLNQNGCKKFPWNMRWYPNYQSDCHKPLDKHLC